MNRTKEQLRKAVFGKLQGLRRKLQAQGVHCTYAGSVLSHASGDIGFKITFRLADDGATLLPQISVLTAEGTENLDHLPLDQGIARLKELFHAPDSNGSQGSDTRDRDTQDGNGYIVAPQNRTPSRHEGDTN